MLISAWITPRRSTEFRAIAAKLRVSTISAFLRHRRHCFLAIHVEFNILAHKRAVYLYSRNRRCEHMLM